jgi:hypothetical protein
LFFNGVRDYFVVDSTFAFLPTHKPTLKNAKEPPSQRTKPTHQDSRQWTAQQRQKRTTKA